LLGLGLSEVTVRRYYYQWIHNDSQFLRDQRGKYSRELIVNEERTLAIDSANGHVKTRTNLTSWTTLLNSSTRRSSPVCPPVCSLNIK
jgi:hypothetical protein